MGTTRTRFQAGSMARRWVAAIEGYPNLLTDADTVAAALTAWAATSYAAGVGGLYVELECNQAIDPWEPFGTGGSLTLRVAQDAADTFGIAVGKKIHTGETTLGTSLDRDDATITVKDTSTFASSGTAYIGTESFAYAGVTGTTFTTATRGSRAPFANGNSGTTFSQTHRVQADPNGVNLHPVVTSGPRVWEGRWVGLWAHNESAGVLDVKAQAELVYAGRITDHGDDPGMLCTTVEVEHVLDYIKDATLGRDMYSAKIIPGITLRDGVTVAQMRDTQALGAVGGTIYKTATPLTVVTGATPPYEIEPGTYTYDQMYSFLNDWLAQAHTDADLYGTYSFYFGYGFENEGFPARTYVEWMIPGTGPIVEWELKFSPAMCRFLGFVGDPQGQTMLIGALGDDDTLELMHSENPPQIFSFTSGNTGPDGLPTLALFDERGTFCDQFASLPSSCQVFDAGGLEYGIFLVDNTFCIYAGKDGTTLRHVEVPTLPYAGEKNFTNIAALLLSLDKTISDPPVEIRQIFVIDTSFALMMLQLFYSTGTAGYNHATYDVLPHALGLAIPGDLLGSAFETSVLSLPSAGAREVLIIDEPKKLSEVFGGSLVMRRAFLRFVSQHLEFCTWKTPNTAISIATLDSTNKAIGSGISETHDAPTKHTDQWARSIVKVQYDRDITNSDRDAGFRSDITYEDARAIDDAGGIGKVRTITLPTIVEKATVEELSIPFIGLFSLFSSGNETLQRSIDPRYYLGYGVGDCVLMTDPSARDPDTGRRGVTARPALITRNRWAPGGMSSPNEKEGAEMSGEVELLLLPVNRIAAYVPCADVDDTATDAGYDSAKDEITVYAHRYSETSEAVDASHFAATYAIRITERDPADPTTPLTWDATVTLVTGNVIQINSGAGGSLTAFDVTKKYRVVFDDYTAVVAAQAVKTFQADDADYLVLNARQPFQYGYGQIVVGAYTANAASDAIELPPDNSFGDGVGRDVGHETALNRLVTAHVDRNAAHTTPFLGQDVMTGTGASGTYKLVAIEPLSVHLMNFSNGVYRTLAVAPWLRSSDGTSSSVRVTIARNAPGQDTIDDVDRGTIYTEAVFSGITSTTWATATAVNLDLSGIPDGWGTVFLLLECTVKAECRGLAEAQVSARTYP